MTTHFPIGSRTVAALNPKLLYKADHGAKSLDRAAQYPFNADFTGFAEVKESMVKQFEFLDAFREASGRNHRMKTPKDANALFESIKTALIGAIKLPPRPREMVFGEILRKVGEVFPQPPIHQRKTLPESGLDGTPKILDRPNVLDLARFLQDELTPKGYSSPAVSKLLSSPTKTQPRWTLDYHSLNSARLDSRNKR
jgi:hypothetical protein